ncbi:death domain-associated protein 6 isoform X2 [Neoarius graeffei]|uniref:death domain-associated protein 6 isoform X2 n=1 Tax=Neoarius graeffei TaxID=443677 RepID=UPI00298CA784|nr:death domain-associated protein 6 isoform X2 [Neoarius graeffei]
MAAFTKVMDSIVILDDDDDAQDPSSSSWHPQTACMSSTSNIPQPPAAHIAESPFASTKKESHVLKVENEKLFGEFLDHCIEHTREHPEVLSFLKTKYSKSSPEFLMSVEFRNAVGRCLTRAQAQTTKTFVYINELCTMLKQHSTKRRATIQPSNAKKQEKTWSRDEEEHGNTDVKVQSASRQTEVGDEERKTKRASRRQIAYLENLLKVYRDEIRRLQERDLNFEDLEKEDSSYIQEHKLKRKMMKIYDKLCELKNCSTLTGRVMEQKIRYSGTRYPEINKKIERFINQPEVHQNPPDYRDILQVVKRTNERNQLMLSRKQEAQIAQEVFRETGNRLQERRHLDMIYNFGSHLTDAYKPTLDPALTDPLLAQKLRANREVALSSLEEVINKYANKQDDTEEEERRKRLEKEKQKKENDQQESKKAGNSDKSGDEEDDEEDDDDDDDDDDSSDPDIEEEIQASAAQVRPDEEDNEEEHLSITDDIVQPSSNGSCPSVKSSDCGDAGESGDEDPQSDSRTCVSVTTETCLEEKHSSDSPSSSNSHDQSGVLNPQSAENTLLVSNSCPSADSNSISEATEIPSTPENRVSTPLTISTSHPEMTNKMCNNKKRKRESNNHMIVQNGNIRRSDVSDVSLDIKVAYSPVQVDSTRADTPTQDMVSSSRSTPPPKKHKHPGINVPVEAEQCDTPIIGAHSPVPLFEKGNHHPGLPLHNQVKFISIALLTIDNVAKQLYRI